MLGTCTDSTLHTSFLTAIALSDPLYPPWPSLRTACFFVLCACVAKCTLLTHLLLFLPCFCFPPVPSHPTAPIGTDLYSSAPIHTTFCQTRKNMMSGEISPAIATDICPANPFLSVLALFLCPPMHAMPQRTHPHPFTPIYITSHPFAMHFYNVCMLI